MIFTAAVLAVATLAATSVVVSTQAPNECPQPGPGVTVPPYFFYGDRDNCSKYYQCDVDNKPILRDCSPVTRWSDFFQTCAGYNSHFDTCTRDNAERECNQTTDKTLLIPDPKDCWKYYNCSQPGPVSPGLRPYQEECPYPQQFDVVTKQCGSYTTTYCGPLRQPEVDACKYEKNKCNGPNCIPCRERFPSCVGLTDGSHEFPGRLWSPFYVICSSERVSPQVCPAHQPTNTTSIYSPVSQRCVSLWEVPREFGGLAPSCQGKSPGLYQTAENPQVYYRCPGEQVFYCQPGWVFDASTQSCVRA